MSENNNLSIPALTTIVAVADAGAASVFFGVGTVSEWMLVVKIRKKVRKLQNYRDRVIKPGKDTLKLVK